MSKLLTLPLILIALLSAPVCSAVETVSVNNARLFIGDDLHEAKHVGYSGLRKGETIGRPLDVYSNRPRIEYDLDWIKSMNANGIRTWSEVNDNLVSALEKINLKVAATISMPWQATYSDVGLRDKLIKQAVEHVSRYKHSSAILFWVIGNEVEINISKDQVPYYFSLVEEMAQAIKGEDPAHPVGVAVAGNYYFTYKEYDPQLPSLDIWVLNLYWGETFAPARSASLWKQFAYASNKALYIGEYEVDAFYHTDLKGDFSAGYEDEEGQAKIVANLAREIRDQVVFNYVKGASSAKTIGGAYFQFNDQWWQNQPWSDDCDTHDVEEDGHYRGGHDGYDDLEWNGIFKDASTLESPYLLKPRLVYESLKKVWSDK